MFGIRFGNPYVCIQACTLGYGTCGNAGLLPSAMRRTLLVESRVLECLGRRVEGFAFGFVTAFRSL